MDANSKVLENVKGTTDYLPQQMMMRNRVIATLRSGFESYGFLPLETATICHFDLLSYKYAGGADILKEVYTLSDQGERKLGLRYDLTVPFSKVIGMNQDIRMPFRRYEIGKVYRDGPVKTGRSREFYQCDVDVVGLGGQAVEAEFFKMAVDTYRRLGIEIYIQYNNRKFMSGVIEHCGIASEYVSAVILKVDALVKHGEKYVRDEIKTIVDDQGSRAVSDDSIDRLMNYINMSVDALLTEFAGETEGLLADGMRELAALNEYLKGLGIADSCVFTPSLARGLEIYTGTVWEVYDQQMRITSALGAGGRYDNIITKFMDNGKEYPAVGMSFGLEPICVLLYNEQQSKESNIDLFVIPMGTTVQSMQFADQLRACGLKVLVDLTGAKMKKSLDYANKEGIGYVAILGDNELTEGEFELKNMFDKSLNARFALSDVQGIAKYIKG